ncbi:MAG TPA: hypothetical protein VJ939_01710 [Bacteroidales bacterium]|nr:hypothetical protein [Bacteroidales bacterium]
MENTNMRVVSPPLGGRGASGGKKHKTIILRPACAIAPAGKHDVDKLPGNSLEFAQIQHELGIKGTYFFRIVPESFNPEIIEKIAGLGHEIGYHYEDVDLASQSIKHKVSSIKTTEQKERIISEEALILFEKHLNTLRKYYPANTICMHGSPLSKYDNKLLWKYYNYRDYGIIGEPYFDVDFTKVLYLTDTGRRWNGEKVSVRDKVKSRVDTPLGNKGEGEGKENLYFKKTSEIIQAANQKELPDQIMPACRSITRRQVYLSSATLD